MLDSMLYDMFSSLFTGDFRKLNPFLTAPNQGHNERRRKPNRNNHESQEIEHQGLLQFRKTLDAQRCPLDGLYYCDDRHKLCFCATRRCFPSSAGGVRLTYTVRVGD
jgi:hypothetical protein